VEKIINFLNFSLLNEATIDDSKHSIIYELSRDGRKAANRLNISENLTFDPIYDEYPNDDIEVLYIRPSSIRTIEFSKLKQLLNINTEEDLSDLLVYNSTSRKYPYMVVKSGTRTTMIRQKERKGVTKRGEHFRETAFMIIFVSRIWERFEYKIGVYSNRGKIDMDFLKNDKEERFAIISEKERGGLRIRFEEFMSNKGVYNSMIRQSDKLIDFLGKSIYNIDSVIKNSSEILISHMAKVFIDDEFKFSKEGDASEYDTYNFPKTVNISKWNPSDIWICYKDGIRAISDYRWYDINDFDLDTFNDYLGNSIQNRRGVIGVSLKQQERGESYVRTVNMMNDDVQHKFLSFKASNSVKNVIVKFSYKFSKSTETYNDGELHIRTFDTGLTSAISVEVKGSKKAQHMSGKAGSLLSTIVPSNIFSVMEKFRKEKDIDNIREIINSHNFISQEVKDLVYADLESDKKTQEMNSRIQALLLVDWLLSIDPISRNRFVSTIVKFAKSESIWSAPHLVLK
jgi:hypothetical protein